MGNKIHDEEQNRIKFYLQLIENKIMQLSTCNKREYDLENLYSARRNKY